jgi:caffeoyl-CoA O-methyltransferase
MDFIPADINKYSEDHTTPENEVLSKLNRDTHAHVMMPRMLSGHLQGKLLSLLSTMIRPERVLEIGTYTGYSAICLAEGLTETGKLITVDINEELEAMARKYFQAAGLQDKISYLIGDARQIIPGLNEKFDLVFIDADKENYSLYYDLVFDKVKKGGYIIADNVLWSGKVLMEKPDKDTISLINYNKKIHADNRVENLLLPVRDGLMICRKLV